MGKTNGENLDLKSKLNAVLGITANTRKGLESLKTKIENVKSDHAMFKKDLNFFKNEFTEYLKESLKVGDSLVKIDNDILTRKNEFYINSKNINHVIKNDMLIFRANCIKLKSIIRENVKSLKNIKNNLYDIEKDSDSIQIDLRKLKEEFFNNSNKGAKIRSIILPKIKAYNFKIIMREVALALALAFNKSKIKTNINDSGIIDACTRAGDPIVKKYVNACTSTDDLIVKSHADACTSTDDVCNNENEPCTNEPCTNENEPCTNENEPCTNENEPCTNENEPCTNENEPCTNDDDDDDDDNNSDIGKLRNFGDKVLNKLINVSETRKEILINIKKILATINKANNISKNDLKLKLDEYKKLNILVDDLINLIWILMYGENRVNNEINNIDADKEKDANRYVHKYINIVNDKISLLNNESELVDDLLGGIDVNTSNDIALKKLKDFKSHIAKLINRFNLYIKQDTKKKDSKNTTKPDTKNNTKNNTKPDIKNNTKTKDTKNNTKPDTRKKDTKNNTKPDTENDIEWDINDTRKSIRKNQITIKTDIKVYQKQGKLSEIILVRYIVD